MTITFKRALPQNLQEVAQSVSLLGSIVSDETKRSILPIEIDEDVEKERLAQEREAGMSLFTAGEMDAMSAAVSGTQSAAEREQP